MLVRYARVQDLAKLRALRRSVFQHELGVQLADYQDVFNDHFCRNVILADSDQIIGGIRLALCRYSKRFYLSYLVLHPSWRNGILVRQLLGGVLHLMQINGVSTALGHTTADNLPMYESVGCRIVGPPFRKHGFDCQWFPFEYALGTNPRHEEQLIRQAARFLSAEEGRWYFTPWLFPFQDATSYANFLTRCIPDSLVGHYIPHLGSIDDLPESTTCRFRPSMTCLPELEHALPDGRSAAFAEVNTGLSPRELVMVPAGAEEAPLAVCYALLFRSRLCYLDNIGNVNADATSQVVLFSRTGRDAKEATRCVQAVLPHAPVRTISGRNLADVSRSILTEFVVSVTPQVGAVRSDPRTTQQILGRGGQGNIQKS